MSSLILEKVNNLITSTMVFEYNFKFLKKLSQEKTNTISPGISNSCNKMYSCLDLQQLCTLENVYIYMKISLTIIFYTYNQNSFLRYLAKLPYLYIFAEIYFAILFVIKRGGHPLTFFQPLSFSAFFLLSYLIFTGHSLVH